MRIHIQPNADSQSSEYYYRHYVDFMKTAKVGDSFYVGDKECYEHGLKIIPFCDDGSFDDKNARSKKKFKKWKDYESVVWIIRTKKAFVILSEAGKFYKTSEAPFIPVDAEEFDQYEGAKLLSEVEPNELVNNGYKGCRWELLVEDGSPIPNTVKRSVEKLITYPFGGMKLRFSDDLRLSIVATSDDGRSRTIPEPFSLTMDGDDVIVTSLKEGPIKLSKELVLI